MTKINTYSKYAKGDRISVAFSIFARRYYTVIQKYRELFRFLAVTHDLSDAALVSAALELR